MGGKTLIQHAIACGQAVAERVIVTSDYQPMWADSVPTSVVMWLQRPTELAQDDSAMIDVVRHALDADPFQPKPADEIILLLQPTAVFRKPKHLAAAIELLQTSGADSVVSVVELPKTHSPELVVRKYADMADGGWSIAPYRGWQSLPMRRQDVAPAYIRDGTVYAFRRRTLDQCGHIYGLDCRPLIIPPEETCELDTIQDWEAVERRWKERHVQQP